MKKNRFLRFVLTTAVWVSLGGTVAFSQSLNNRTVTLSIKQAKLGKILKSIQEKSATQIVYNGQLVDKVAAQTVVAKNEKLTDLLDRILKGTGLGYTIENNVIVIRPVKHTSAAVSVSISTIGGQYAKVQGNIQLSNGQPKALVTIVNKATGGLTLSDPNGFFQIDAKEGDQLHFSHVGYKSYQATVRNDKAMKVTLEEQSSTLEEVVLTGYQTIEKKLSTGSIVTLKGKDVAEPNVPNIASMLQGKVPGLAVMTLSGSPNSVPRMRMRGTSTLIGNAAPLWVIDGIVQEPPSDVDPDNPMGLNATDLDKILRAGVSQVGADLMGNSISGININDIESISFLKDAAATALYGTKAANGVILLTTKKGKAGRNIISYSTNLGFVQRPSYSSMNLMDSKQRVQLSRELNMDGILFENAPFEFGYEGAYWDLINKRITQEEFNARVSKMETQNTDWFKYLFRNSFNQSHSFSLSGGTEQTTYRASINYGNNKGAAQKDGLTTMGGQLALVSHLNKKLKVEFTLDANIGKGTGYNGINPMSYALTTSRTLAPDLVYTSIRRGFLGDVSLTPLHYNILNDIEETGATTKTNGLLGNLNLTYKILPGLTYTSLFGLQLSDQSADQYQTERSYDVAFLRGYDYGSVTPGSVEEMFSPLPFGGILNNSNSNMLHYTWRNMLSYDLSPFNDRNKLSFNLGEEINSTRREGYNNYKLGYLKDRGERFAEMEGYLISNAYAKENRIVNLFGAFATASYAFDEKYILAGSARLDASNRFGQYTNSRFQPVWSISGRWNISRESWLRDNKWISDLDISGSYGFQGNAVDKVGPDLILSIPQYQALNPLLKEYELRLKSLPYPDLRWEKTSSSNLRLNLGLFNSRIAISAEVYGKKTHDALTYLDIPREYGVEKMIVNGGTISNKGWDLSLMLNPIKNTNWNWWIQATTSKVYNKLLTSEVSGRLYTLENYLNGDVKVSGVPLNTFYVFGFKGLNPKNGTPLFKHVDDVADPSKLDVMDVLINAGVKDPTLTGGISNSLSYKNWSFSASFTFGFGAHRLRNPYYGTELAGAAPTAEQNMQTWLIDRWRKPGDELHTDIPAFPNYRVPNTVFVGNLNESRYRLYNNSDKLLAKADFLKCRLMSLGYRLPGEWTKRINLSQATVGASMSNVFTLAGKAWKGQDPEIPGVGSTALPQQPMYNLNINISF